MSKQNWMSQGNCASLTPEQTDELFFIGPGKSSKRAQLFCASCPVKRECSNFAITYNEYGIWAGSTEEDRRNLDPFIAEVLRDQALAEGRLESRNINDFIPLARQTIDEADLLAQLLLEDRLAAQDHPFDYSIYPQQYEA